MSFDITSKLDIGLGPLADVAPSAQSADPASAGSAPLAEDAISTSPLAYFGDMVQQIGRSMAQDPAAAAHDPAAHGAAMDEAIGMLESVIGLMSLSGESGEAAMQSLATNSAPSLESLD